MNTSKISEVSQKEKCINRSPNTLDKRVKISYEDLSDWFRSGLRTEHYIEDWFFDDVSEMIRELEETIQKGV